MASDAVGLIDQLKYTKAHIIGASMGGMITQVIGLDYPDLATTTPQCHPRYRTRRFKSARSHTRDDGGIIESMKLNMEGEYEDALVVNYRVLSGSRFPFNEEKFREQAKDVIAHGYNPFRTWSSCK